MAPHPYTFQPKKSKRYKQPLADASGAIMVRRRASAPSALMLLPASVPLVRGQPKFILPSPPSEYATIHLADHKKLSDNCYNFKNLEPIKELPRLKDLQISDHIKIQNL